MKTRSFAAQVLPVVALLAVATPATWADDNSPWGEGWAMDAMGMHETAIETKASGAQAKGKTVQSGKLGAGKHVPDLPDQAAQGKLSRSERAQRAQQVQSMEQFRHTERTQRAQRVQSMEQFRHMERVDRMAGGRGR
jgi:hypothetical protein